jgi:hypothetical protein
MTDTEKDCSPGDTENPRMTRWVQNGDRWECDAYDHGPFCRQCRNVGPSRTENVEEPK